MPSFLLLFKKYILNDQKKGWEPNWEFDSQPQIT
jgi:hypothetical protein